MVRGMGWDRPGRKRQDDEGNGMATQEDADAATVGWQSPVAVHYSIRGNSETPHQAVAQSSIYRGSPLLRERDNLR